MDHAPTAAPAPPASHLPVLATAPPTTKRGRSSARGRSGSGGNANVRMLLWGLFALVLLLIGSVVTGAVQLSAPDGGATERPGGADTGGAWSYFHDREYDTDTTGPKWQTDRTRSTDPDEAALGDTSRWEYDGPYRYGPYGSDGMQRRAGGREAVDPLYSQAAPIQDVFSAYGGDLDPSGGAPVGIAPSSATNPYYDPFAGHYTNPYANRVRMAYGEGYDRGALLGLE
ncbi:MAG: hypothetical protein JWM25_1544 [Thermoleophilia bacterium]|nr:hypothetical protein [Thermoleophilia bacterium]MCZ4496959.1 hypothetical protein [Thermoleophilia bacterium]